MNLHFVTVISEERSIHLFLTVVLPNLLSPGNLPFFAGSQTVSYKVYSAKESLDRITSSQIFQRLCKIVPAWASAPRSGSAEDFAERCHKEAVSQARKAGAALILLAPDTVWSAGALKRMGELCQGGACSVDLVTPELDEKTFVPAFMRRFVNNDGQGPAPCRELVGLALDHLHPATKSRIVNDGGSFSESFDDLYWRVGSEGLVARCVRFRTVMLCAGGLSETLDNCDGYVVTDSDEIAAFRIAPSQKPYLKPAKQKFSPLRLAERLHAGAGAAVGDKMQRAIRIHTDDISNRWLAVEEKSGGSVSKALSVAWIMDTFPKPLDHVKRVALFGSGAGGITAARLAQRCGWEVARLIDNNPHMWGKHIAGHCVKGPESLRNRDYELIVVSSEPGKEAIFQQLTDMGFIYRDDFIYFRDTVCVNGLEIFIDYFPNHMMSD